MLIKFKSVLEFETFCIDLYVIFCVYEVTRESVHF